MENEGNFCFAYASLFASTEAEEKKILSGCANKWEPEESGVWNADHKLFLYGDTGFERKWENCFNDALSLCWWRLHSGLILPVEIFTVPETTISKVGKVTLSLPACDELSFFQIAN